MDIITQQMDFGKVSNPLSGSQRLDSMSESDIMMNTLMVMDILIGR
jgi:hypothetical protein